MDPNARPPTTDPVDNNARAPKPKGPNRAERRRNTSARYKAKLRKAGA